MRPLRLLVAATCCANAFAQTDEQVRQRIQQVGAAAADILIDGDATDWETVPKLTDSPVDSRGGAKRDITAVAIAPRTRDLLILIETDSPPSPDTLEFMVNVDLLGSPDYDFMLGIGANGRSTIALYDGRDPEPYQSASNVEAAIGPAVEACVPYDMLRSIMPLEMREKFSGTHERTWMRIAPMVWDSSEKHYADFGPATASYRLEPMASLDSRLEREADSPLIIAPPFRGRWYCSQGAFNEQTHAGDWAFDFEIVNEHLRSFERGKFRRNEGHLAWAKPLYAPESGTVVRVSNDAPDNLPFEEADKTKPVNGVGIKISDDAGIWLGHFRQASASVELGQFVARGTQIGEVGNSGWSNRPHLHIAAFHLPTAMRTRPLALSNVIVSLNPVDDAPWARRVAEWVPRQGMFVEGL